jgi:hypothetical protein
MPGEIRKREAHLSFYPHLYKNVKRLSRSRCFYQTNFIGQPIFTILMAHYANIANKMAIDFIRSKDKTYALNKILHDLNFLIYSDTKELLNYNAKAAIMKHIFDLLAGRRAFLKNDSKDLRYEFTDIIIFFERENFIRKQLNTCLKQRIRMN